MRQDMGITIKRLRGSVDSQQFLKLKIMAYLRATITATEIKRNPISLLVI
jgi:hypothetical protein